MNHSTSSPVTRRHFLWQAASGLSGIALTWLLQQERLLGAEASASPYAPRPSHFPARAQRVIHIYAAGGVSHVDTFDHKPDLAKYHGKELTNKGKIDTFFGRPGNLLKSPFEFRQYGQNGMWVSDLLPHLGTCVDDMT